MLNVVLKPTDLCIAPSSTSWCPRKFTTGSYIVSRANLCHTIGSVPVMHQFSGLLWTFFPSSINKSLPACMAVFPFCFVPHWFWPASSPRFMLLGNHMARCLVFQSVCCSARHGPAPCLLVLSPVLLFSRLNGSMEALGRKKTSFAIGQFRHPAASLCCWTVLLLLALSLG